MRIAKLEEKKNQEIMEQTKSPEDCLGGGNCAHEPHLHKHKKDEESFLNSIVEPEPPHWGNKARQNLLMEYKY